MHNLDLTALAADVQAMNDVEALNDIAQIIRNTYPQAHALKVVTTDQGGRWQTPWAILDAHGNTIDDLDTYGTDSQIDLDALDNACSVLQDGCGVWEKLCGEGQEWDSRRESPIIYLDVAAKAIHTPTTPFLQALTALSLIKQHLSASDPLAALKAVEQTVDAALTQAPAA